MADADGVDIEIDLGENPLKCLLFGDAIQIANQDGNIMPDYKTHMQSIDTWKSILMTFTYVFFFW